MVVSPEYKAFLEDIFSEFGPVRIRSMFGGGGVYLDGVMFALVAGETLYLKADDTNRPDFEAEGMTPFTYDGKGKPVTMSYWELPEALYDDPHELAVWARKAHNAACHARRA